MLIIGSKFFKWGSEKTVEQMRCGECGNVSQFNKKKGMRFITLFFIIPTIPISGISHMTQCPQCKAMYQAEKL